MILRYRNLCSSHCWRVPNIVIHIIFSQYIIKSLIISAVSFIEVYAAEFQKGGFPYAHILLTVVMEDKPACPEDVDRLISVKILDQTTNPIAYDIVTRFMILGPCVSCLIDGCLLYTSPSPRDGLLSRMPSSA